MVYLDQIVSSAMGWHGIWWDMMRHQAWSWDRLGIKVHSQSVKLFTRLFWDKLFSSASLISSFLDLCFNTNIDWWLLSSDILSSSSHAWCWCLVFSIANELRVNCKNAIHEDASSQIQWIQSINSMSSDDELHKLASWTALLLCWSVTHEFSACSDKVFCACSASSQSGISIVPSQVNYHMLFNDTTKTCSISAGRSI